MKVYELMQNIDIQEEVKFVYYDYQKDKLIEMNEKEAQYKEMKYMYVNLEKTVHKTPRTTIIIETEGEDE